MNNTILVLVLLTNLRLLAASRLGAAIRWASAQGFLLGLMMLLTDGGILSPSVWAVALPAMILKGWVFPRLLFRVLHASGIRREVDPIIGYNFSLLIGLGLLVVCFHLGQRLPLPDPEATTLLVPVAIFICCTGFFLIIARRTAINQVLGYLVLENGIFTFGTALVSHSPMLIELGMLLDLLVAVFVMGIAVFHIAQSFDHLDTDQMDLLKE